MSNKGQIVIQNQDIYLSRLSLRNLNRVLLFAITFFTVLLLWLVTGAQTNNLIDVIAIILTVTDSVIIGRGILNRNFIYDIKTTRMFIIAFCVLFFAFGIAVTSIMTASASPTTEVQPVPLITQVNGGGATLYEGPNTTEYRSITKSPAGTRFLVVGQYESDGETWYQVKLPDGQPLSNTEAWVEAGFVIFVSGNPVNVPIVPSYSDRIDTATPTLTPTYTPEITLTPSFTPSDTPIPTVTETPSPTPIPTPVVSIDESIGSYRYSGPGNDYPIVDFLREDTRLLVQAKAERNDQTWYSVRIWSETETKRVSGWVSSNVVEWISGDDTGLPLEENIPLPPPTVQPTINPISAHICNAGQWFGTCGSNNCGAEYVSQCNADGTGYTCVWHPSQCSVESPPIFTPPRRPGNQTPDSGGNEWVCTQSWINEQIAHFAGLNGKSPAAFKAELIPKYDLNGNGDLDCGDFA